MANPVTENGSQPKKGHLGLTIHMTGGRWLMVGVGALALFTAIGVVWMETSNNSADAGANVGMHAHVQADNTPGKSSPEYAAQVDAYNKKMAKQALQHNKSFIGIPVTSTYSTDLNSTPKNQASSNAPQGHQDSISDHTQKTNGNKPQPPAKPVSQLGNNAIQSEFSVIAASMKTYRAINVGHYIPEAGTTPESYALANNENGLSNEKNSTKSFNPPYIIPGTMIYGVLDNSMKSNLTVHDVIGTLVQGKYNGDRVIGSFEKPKGSNSLVLRFNTLVLPSGKTVDINAYAVSPKTTLPNMATSVNYHILSRSASFVGAAILAGVEGYGQSIAEQGSSSVSSALGGITQTYPTLTPAQTLDVAIGQAAGQLQPVQSALANGIVQPNTVFLSKNTPFGLLVITSGSVKNAVAVNSSGNSGGASNTLKPMAKSLTIH